MKKLLLFTLAISLAFLSCSKDDDNNQPALVGTSWEKVEDGVSVKLTFQTQIDCQIVVSSPGISSAYINNYSYEYEHPNVKMYPKELGMAELKGIINDKRMNIINMSTGVTVHILTKLN